MNKLHTPKYALAQPYEPVTFSEQLQTLEPWRYALLYDRAKYVVAVQGLMLSGLTVLPEQFTHFHRGDLERCVLRTFENHISHKPVIDHDPPIVNASHAFWLGVVIIICVGRFIIRGWSVFVFSSAMSTFHEYFLEAIPEPPSIQDLIVTPIGGAIIGEVLYWLRIPHPLTFIVSRADEAVGAFISRHNIHFEVVYGKGGYTSPGETSAGQREMQIVIRGTF
jgi:hypothetical protein